MSRLSTAREGVAGCYKRFYVASYLINFSDFSSSVEYSDQLFVAAHSILNILSLGLKRPLVKYEKIWDSVYAQVIN